MKIMKDENKILLKNMVIYFFLTYSKKIANPMPEVIHCHFKTMS
jgi:hypothetical protein